MRGKVCIVQGPSAHTAHRLHASQEFAFDVVDNRPSVKSPWRTSKKNDPATVRDFFIFDRPVQAIADGRVMTVAAGFPDRLAENPSEYSAEKMVQLRKEWLPRIGFLNFLYGNHLIIDHGTGEFSLYAHLREGSIGVTAGDQVRQGQLIGRVGNTGNSEEPHLHFQLMDDPDPLRANGLPVLFTDLREDRMALGIDEVNSLDDSEYLYAELEDLH